MRDLEQQLNPDPEPEFVHEEEQDDVQKIQSIVKELDLAGGIARIFRQRPGQAKYEYTGEMPADGFQLESVKRYYGGGDYMIRFAAKGGRYVRQIRFSIDPRIKGEIDKAMEVPVAVQSNSGSEQTQSLIAFMMQQQQSQQQQSQNMMTLMITMMTESQKSMAGVIAAAIGGKPQPEPSSRFIEVMMPMIAEGMKPRGGISEVAETMKLAKELMGPPQEEKDDMLDKIMTVGAPILGALMSRGQNQPQPQPVRPVAPIPPPALPTTEQIASQKAQALLTQLRMVTPILVRAAKKNSAIESYADILDDTLDDEGFGMLCFMLERPDWVQTLFDNNPDVVANIQWFENFRSVILNPSDDDKTTSPTGSEGDQDASPKESPHPFDR